ncbi:hypothetical protein YPPY16_1562, partial [Yersinia pestis PY-16]
MWGA